MIAADELNDELVSIGETILAQMADDYGPEKADEKFHEWNDVIYDICHAAFKRDKDGTAVTISALKDPHTFLDDAMRRDLIRVEQQVEELAHKAFRTWRDNRQSGRLRGMSGYPVTVGTTTTAYGTTSLGGPLPAMGSQTYIQVAANIPDFVREDEARFLITAQVREALLGQV